MTSLLEQYNSTNKDYFNNNGIVTAKKQIMAWSNEKNRFPCVDNIGLKQLWKLLVLDTTNSSTKKTNNTNNNNSRMKKFRNNSNKKITNHNNNQHEPVEKQLRNNSTSTCNEKNTIDLNAVNQSYLSTRHQLLLPEQTSLLKCLAINALELMAPATTVLLQHDEQQQQLIAAKPHNWMQLSGHPESIVPTTSGIVRKKVTSVKDNEVNAYELMSNETKTAEIIPKYFGTITANENANTYIELQDLLAGFKDPCIMDIKLGTRTFLETEVTNKKQRHDLYEKMVAIDPQAPTSEEHAEQAITKLRYMMFRETMSSSHTKGFRIEALRLRGRAPIKELKKVRNNEQIQQTIAQFLGHASGKTQLQRQLLQRLRHMRQTIEESNFFQTHEVVGSSIFIVYDEEHVGVWLIDFAKCRALPIGSRITHRADWQPGNSEEGLLKGFDELINAFEQIKLPSEGYGCKCLQI